MPTPPVKHGVWREVWESQCWRVFPIMLMYIGSKRFASILACPMLIFR